MRISDWSSDVCSSDLFAANRLRVFSGRAGANKVGDVQPNAGRGGVEQRKLGVGGQPRILDRLPEPGQPEKRLGNGIGGGDLPQRAAFLLRQCKRQHDAARSEEHTSELKSLMRISYAVFCLKKQT